MYQVIFMQICMNKDTIVKKHIAALTPVLLSHDPQHCKQQIETLTVKLSEQLSRNNKITYVLPAFPFKSPNPDNVIDCKKVDHAEYIALDKLASLLDEHSSFVVARDTDVFRYLFQIKYQGHEFGVTGDAIASYSEGLSQIISCLNNKYPGFAAQLRFVSFMQLLNEDAKGMDAATILREEQDARRSDLKLNCYRRSQNKGIKSTMGTFFKPILDEMQPEEKEKILDELAINVMLRTDYHQELINREYPDAIRLSVHKQFGTKKIGISLIPGCRRTPWVGTLVTRADGSMGMMLKAEIDPEHYVLAGEVISDNRTSYHYREVTQESAYQ